jgi:hypothetical protein
MECEESNQRLGPPNLCEEYTLEQLTLLSKKELIDIILSLQTTRHSNLAVESTKNNERNNTNSNNNSGANKKKKVVEELDWSRYSLRHIALKFCYLVCVVLSITSVFILRVGTTTASRPVKTKLT